MLRDVVRMMSRQQALECELLLTPFEERNEISPDEAGKMSEDFAQPRRAALREAGKENVPLQELETAEECLADHLRRKTDEIRTAKGDPKKVFGRQVAARIPDTDAVDFCAARIHAANSCGNFLRINRVYALDSQVTEQEAQVTGEIEMAVLAPFTMCSKVASNCTGTCWDARTGRPQPGTGNKERSAEAFNVTRRLRIQRTFAFVKAADGWRCREDELAPVNSGTASGGS